MRACDIENLPYKEDLFPPYFSKAYFNYQNSLGNQVFVLGDEAGTFVPIIVQKKFGFKRGRFLYKPFHPEKRLTAIEEENFLDQLRSFLRKESLADLLLPPQHVCVFQGAPNGVLTTPLGIININLQKTEDEVFSGFQPRYRTAIRKAERDNVLIKFGMSCFSDFYTLFQSTMLREQAVPDSYSTLKKLADYFTPSHIQCGVAYVNGEPDATLFNVYNSLEAYYLYGGTTSPSHHSGSFKLLQWEAMKHLLKEGVKNYELGGVRMGKIQGTKYERIIEFKMRFGATIEQGCHIIMPITAKYYIYQPLMKVYLWSKGIHEHNETMPFKKLTKSS